MTKRIDPLIQPPTSIEVLYLLGMVVAFAAFSFLSSPVLYIVYPVLLWSIYQDWRSARIAQQRRHWYFIISDLITVFNYVSLFIALVLPPHAELGYSERIWLHWGLVFLIYIIWNLVMRALPDTDAASKSFFLRYSLVELPIVIFCLLVFIEAKTGFLFGLIKLDILMLGTPLLLAMAGIHLFILVYWVYQTYISSKQPS